MTTWGLGIEHEIRTLFEKKIIIEGKSYDLYIDSRYLNYLWKLNEMIVYDKHKDKLNKKYKKYQETMGKKKYLLELIKKKRKYPIEDKKYFNIIKKFYNTENEVKIGYGIDSDSIALLEYYYYHYTLNYQNILFYGFYNINESELSNLILWGGKMYDSFNSKDDIYKYINEDLKNLYNNVYEEKKKELIKQFFKNNKDIRFQYRVNHTIYYGTDNSLYQYIRIINDEYGDFMSYENYVKIINNNVKILKKIMNTKIRYNKDIDYNVIMELYANNIPESDFTSSSDCIEFMIINYKNRNYEDGLNDMVKMENNFLNFMNNLEVFRKDFNKYGKLKYPEIGTKPHTYKIDDFYNDYTLEYENFEDYVGSYHIWITCPYDNKLSKEKFLNIHANLGNKLQLLEPLFCSHFSCPSYNYKNDDHVFSSYRLFVNRFSNYGTSDVSLINGSEYFKPKNIFFELKKNPKIYKIYQAFGLAAPSVKFYDKEGKVIMNYGKLEERFITNNLFKFISEGNNNSKNRNVQSFMEKILKKKNVSFDVLYKDYGLDMGWRLGSDIRTKNNQQMMYPLNKDYKKIYYIKNNKYIEHYIDNDGNIYDHRKYNKKKYEKELNEGRIGIEFRILDHVPTIYLNQILSILCYVGLNSLDDKKISNINDTHVSRQFWHNEMYKSVINGYKMEFDNIYIKNIENEFKIKLEKNKVNSSALMENIYNEMKNKYKDNKIAKKIEFRNKIKFFSLNEYAINYINRELLLE